ncbi:MAG TPA: proline racemase family protein [Candidatus Limnocylindrales bacterium]|nr:proline racemase family protein [Candidatus Limnocylindrales bacterium]
MGAPPRDTDQPVPRIYRGPTPEVAAAAYRADAAQAQAAGYLPVSHRWDRDDAGHVLSVVYQLRLQNAPLTDGQGPGSPAGQQPEKTPAKPEAEASNARRRHERLIAQVLDMHCAGEPLRIIRTGYPDVPRLPVLERRRWVSEHADHVRRAVVNEPRGHRDMYGAVILPPYRPDVDACLLFMHNAGYSTMCGHGVIAVTTALIEEGLYPAGVPETTIRYEVPAGVVSATAIVRNGPDGHGHLVDQVRFTNVPSYLAQRSIALRPDGVELHGGAAEIGALPVDMAFGGAYYGIVDAAHLGLRVVPGQASALRRAGAAITELLRRDHQPSHPTDEDLAFVYGTIIVDLEPGTSPDGLAREAHVRNATIFADAELDRSPCGSGTSALLAQLYGRGLIGAGQELVNAGITGEHFVGRVEGETTLGQERAVETSIAGRAFLTGYGTLVMDERDPLAEGFLLG